METEDIKKAIYELVEKSMGKKLLKPGDVFKKVSADNGIDKKEVKNALKELIDEEKLVYSYKGGSYVEIPPK